MHGFGDAPKAPKFDALVFTNCTEHDVVFLGVCLTIPKKMGPKYISPIQTETWAIIKIISLGSRLTYLHRRIWTL